MEYGLSEYCLFFFCYSFLGWALEVSYRVLRTGRLINRGLLNGPVCPGYGAAMCVIITYLGDLGDASPLLQFAVCMVHANIMVILVGLLQHRIAGQKVDPFLNRHMGFLSLSGVLFTMLWGGLALLAYYFIHPFLLLGVCLLPTVLRNVAAGVLFGLFLMDMAATIALLWGKKHFEPSVMLRMRETKDTLGRRIYRWMHRRMCRAYPEFSDLYAFEVNAKTKTRRRFAQGICLHKLFWVFIISALLGDWIETAYVFLFFGKLESRSSLLYGTFSIIWGFGAVVLTLLLMPLSEKGDRHVFFGGFFIGGAYEYLCSYIGEVVFGTVFWDYSWMPLNINGRTNVLYMFFWGLLSVVWVKHVYPPMSRLIENCKPVPALFITYTAVLLLVADMILSGVALARYTDRANGEPARNSVEQFLDKTYSDSLVERTYPSMKVVADSGQGSAQTETGSN